MLPAVWRAINDYGIKIGYRTYDSPELNRLRRQPSGVTAEEPRQSFPCCPWLRLGIGRATGHRQARDVQGPTRRTAAAGPGRPRQGPPGPMTTRVCPGALGGESQGVCT